MINPLKVPSAPFDDEASIEEAIRSLARRGLLYDTGRKRWSPRSQTYQIVWAACPQCNCGHDMDGCLSRECPYEHELASPLSVAKQ
jgi:hypothetical protein